MYFIILSKQGQKKELKYTNKDLKVYVFKCLKACGVYFFKQR